MAAPLKAIGIDVSHLSLDELKQLETDVARRIRQVEAEQREAGFRALEELARRHGLSKADVAQRFARKRSRVSKNQVRYQNPADPTQTWTGRGRKPDWVQEHLDRGRPLAELEV